MIDSTICRTNRHDSYGLGQYQAIAKNDKDSSIPIGFATSEYQYYGHRNFPDSNWAYLERQTFSPEEQSRDYGSWENPEWIVGLLVRLKRKTVRVSVEWSRICPFEDQIDQQALNRYIHFCELLRKAQIEPMVTLYHFTLPKWFADKGGFEKKSNISCFVEFSSIVFQALREHVSLWCTINEPAALVFASYIIGVFPPKKWRPDIGARVLKNLYIAHGQVYKALREMDDNVQIGIAHNSLKFVPYRSWNPLEVVATKIVTHLTHTASLKFFQTGKFELLGESFVETLDTFDFIGVNAYSRPLISMCQGSTHYPGEEMTLMPYREDPGAVYEALKEMHRLTKKPIYLTEVGISTNDSSQRRRFFESVLSIISDVKKEGVDLRGVYIWTLLPTWEWHHKNTQNFSICDEQGDPREGTEPILGAANGKC